MDFPPSQPLDMSAITGQHPNPSVPSDLTHISFNVPFNSNLAGPSLEDILYASSTQKSLERWVHPEGTSEDTPANKLPVHTANLTALRKQCERLATEPSGPAPVQASVIAFEPKHEPSLRRPRKGLVTNVCLSGPDSVVRKARGQILRSSPIMISAIVDVEVKHLIDVSTNSAYAHSIEELDLIAQHAGVDIFLLSPKPVDGSSRAADGGPATGIDDRLRVAIYGDVESVEVARTRILIMIDKLMGMNVDAERAEVTMHPMIAGRARRNITMIEAMTETQIYLPYPFSGAFGYVPSGLDRQERERLDQIFITGKPENIAKAQLKLREISSRLKLFSKTISLSPAKIDSIILDRMSKIRKTMERNATHVQLPPLGSQSSMIRVQGMEGVHIERTCREIMVMAGQFYSASWWVSPMTPVPTDIKAPSAVDTRTTLSDVCVSSGAELSYDKSTFSICGSDESVRWALSVLHAVKYTTRTPYQIRVKLELAQEHKEFVSGKKNGKINKIMSQSKLTIVFHSLLG